MLKLAEAAESLEKLKAATLEAKLLRDSAISDLHVARTPLLHTDRGCYCTDSLPRLALEKTPHTDLPVKRSLKKEMTCCSLCGITSVLKLSCGIWTVPALEAVTRQLNCLSKADIVELKCLQRPPAMIQTVEKKRLSSLPCKCPD